MRTFKLTLIALLLATGVAHARSPLDGRLQVVNERGQPITVAIDGEHVARLGPRERRVIGHVANGVRWVEIGARFGPETSEVKVPVRGLATLRVAPVEGTALIRNRSGLRMVLEVDGSPVATLRDRQTHALSLEPGEHRVALRPADAGLRSLEMKQVVHVAPRRTSKVSFGEFYGRLTVRNPAPRGARLFIDGAPLGYVGGRSARTFRDIRPGVHTVELRRNGRTLAVERITVDFGEHEAWSPRRDRPEHVSSRWDRDDRAHDRRPDHHHDRGERPRPVTYASR